MNFIRKNLVGFGVALSFFLIFGIVVAANYNNYGYSVANGGSQTSVTITGPGGNAIGTAKSNIEEHNVCRIVTNQTGKGAAFIPTKSSVEWQKLWDGNSRTEPLPSGLSLAQCTPSNCSGGYCYRQDQPLGALCDHRYEAIDSPEVGNAHGSLKCGFVYANDIGGKATFGQPFTRGQEGAASFTTIDQSTEFEFRCSVEQAYANDLSKGFWVGTDLGQQAHCGR